MVGGADVAEEMTGIEKSMETEEDFDCCSCTLRMRQENRVPMLEMPTIEYPYEDVKSGIHKWFSEVDNLLF